jgi:predicted nucleic acid-binding Zn ribbon protein
MKSPSWLSGKNLPRWLGKNPETMTTEALIKTVRSHCAFCGKSLEKDRPCFLATFEVALHTEGKKLAGKDVLVRTDGLIFAGFTPAPGSAAEKEGVGVGFKVCSKECHEKLSSHFPELRNIQMQELVNDRLN